VTGMEERAGAHRNSGSTLGGRVAPVVVDVRGGVLQHWCGRGKRDFTPIQGMAKLGGLSLERWHGGDSRTESGAEERLRQRKANEADPRSVGKHVWRSGVDG
jgi:hypothetical protein